MNAEEIIAEGEAFADNEDAFDDLMGPADLIDNLAKIARTYRTALLQIATEYKTPLGTIAREALDQVHRSAPRE
jgi:hypothetical protein